MNGASRNKEFLCRASETISDTNNGDVKVKQMTSQRMRLISY